MSETEETEATEATAIKRYHEAEDRLFRRPRFRTALEDFKKAPAVVIECPDRHHLIEVVLSMDHNWHPFLEASPGPRGRTVIDGWDGLFGGRKASAASADAIVRERVRFKCSQCSYDGSHTQEDLLGLYADVLEAGQGPIRLGVPADRP